MDVSGEVAEPSVHSLLERMRDKVASQRAMGYLYALVHVTETERDAEFAARTLKSLEDGVLVVYDGVGVDNTRKDARREDHLFFMAKWGDAFGLEKARADAAERRAKAESDAARKATAKPRKVTKAVGTDGKAPTKAKKPAKRKAAKPKPAKPKAAKPGTADATLH